MGSCWSGFLAELAKIRRPIDYIERTHQARAARYHVRDRGDGIEFDNLLSEDEYEIETKPQQKVLTDEECTFINQKRYDDLVKKQKAINVQIDEKLQKQEENLRLEEEARYAAKREAARVAREGKGKQVKVNQNDTKINKILDDSAFASWLSDDEDDGQDDDHDLDTQEFEEFLAKVRQTSYYNGPSLEGQHESSENHIKEVETTTVAKQSLDGLEPWAPTFDDDDN